MTTTTLDVAAGTPVPPVPMFRERHPLLVQIARYGVAGGAGTPVNALIFLTLRTIERPADAWRTRHRWVLRTAFALVAGAALVLSSAGSCDTPAPPSGTTTGY